MHNHSSDSVTADQIREHDPSGSWGLGAMTGLQKSYGDIHSKSAVGLAQLWSWYLRTGDYDSQGFKEILYHECHMVYSQWAEFVKDGMEILDRVTPGEWKPPFSLFVDGLSTVSDLLANPPAMPETIIPGYAGRCDVVTLFGASKSLKTFTAIDLALQASSGGHWFTGRFSRPMRVGYIDGELRRSCFADRIRKVMDCTQIDLGESIDLWCLRDTGAPATVETFLWECGRLKSRKLDLLIIDNLSRFYPEWPGFSENDNTGMSKVIAIYQNLAREVDAAILLMHHTAKGIHDGRPVSDMGAGAGSIGRYSDGNAAIGRFRPDGDDKGEPRWEFRAEPRNFPSASLPMKRHGYLWRPEGGFYPGDPVVASIDPWDKSNTHAPAKTNTGDDLVPLGADATNRYLTELRAGFSAHVAKGGGASLTKICGWIRGRRQVVQNYLLGLATNETLVVVGEKAGSKLYALADKQDEMFD